MPQVLNLHEVNSNSQLHAVACLVMYRFRSMQIKPSGQLDSCTGDTVFCGVPYIVVEIYIPYQIQPLSSNMKMEEVGPSETSSHLYQTAQRHFPYDIAAVYTTITTS